MESSRSNGNACDFRAAPTLRGPKSRSRVTSSRGRIRGPYNRVRVSRQSARCIVCPLVTTLASRGKQADFSRSTREHRADNSL